MATEALGPAPSAPADLVTKAALDAAIAGVSGSGLTQPQVLARVSLRI